MKEQIKKSIHYPCPYGNDECPKCKPVMNQTNNRIREEWKNAIVGRVTFQKYLCCGGDFCDTDCGEEKMKDVADWWLSKIAELLKSQEERFAYIRKTIKEELVEKKITFEDTHHLLDENEIIKVFPIYQTLKKEKKEEILKLVIKWANEELLNLTKEE